MTSTKYLQYLLPTGTNCECFMTFACVQILVPSAHDKLQQERWTIQPTDPGSQQLD